MFLSITPLRADLGKALENGLKAQGDKPGYLPKSLPSE
jgi:hypothetical protein